MKCSKCNQDIPDDASYCPKCGEKVIIQEENANNEKEKTQEENENGEKIVIQEENKNSDNSNNESSNNQKKDKENKKENGFKKAFLEKWNGLNSLNKIFAVLFILFGCALIIALLFSKTLSGIISIIQLGGVTFAYLIEKDKIHMKKNWYKYAIIIVCVLLSYCYIKAFSNNSNVEEPIINENYTEANEEVAWSELVMGEKIPELSGHNGKVTINTDRMMNIRLFDITNKEYYKYLEECREKGYTIDEVKTDYTFKAVSEENLKLDLIFNSFSNELNIMLTTYKKENKQENIIENNSVVEFENTVSNKTNTENIVEQNTIKEEVKKEEQPKQEEKPKQEEQPKQEQKEPESDGKISIPKAASSFKYEKYQDVLTGFTSLGFTNVKTNVIYDVGNGWFSSSSAGDVKEVSINGNNSFNKGDRFDKNAEVVITYRDFETNVPDTSFVKYTVNKLEQDLDTNPLNAKDTHNGELVEITGKLSNIDSSGKYIALERTDEPYSIRTISCYIKNDEQKEKIKNMTVGKTITVRGKITGVGEVLGYSMDIYSIP